MEWVEEGSSISTRPDPNSRYVGPGIFRDNRRSAGMLLVEVRHTAVISTHGGIEADQET
jgi:hypothetical protein